MKLRQPPKRTICTGQVITEKNEPDFSAAQVIPIGEAEAEAFRGELLQGREQFLRACKLLPICAAVVTVIAWLICGAYAMIFGALILVLYWIVVNYVKRSMALIAEGVMTIYAMVVTEKATYRVRPEDNTTYYLGIGGTMAEVAGVDYDAAAEGSVVQVAVTQHEEKRVFCGIYHPKA